MAGSRSERHSPPARRRGPTRFASLLCIICAPIALAACGGGAAGTGTGLESTAPPPPSPPPPPPPPPPTEYVELLPNPVTQEFAVLGAGDPLRIRYDAASNQYQVKAGDRDWDRLIDDPQSHGSVSGPSNSLIFASTSGIPNGSYFLPRVHHQAPGQYQYRYSNLAPWAIRTGVDFTTADRGVVAVGISTPAGGVPVNGTGSYTGLIEGRSTILEPYEGQQVADTVDGTIRLRFDFAAGTLAGQIEPLLYRAAGRVPLPVLNFIDTIFGVGNREFSGRFATAIAGPNSFNGRFTGPQAEELIGRWAFPFAHPDDGSPQSAEGAMVARRD